MEPDERASRLRRWAPVVWSTGLGLLMLGPALGRGYVLTYDMVWVPDLALGPEALGVGSGLPRAVPSDAVVAVLDEAVGASLLQVLVLLGALVVGGSGAAGLVPGLPMTARLVSSSVYVWNPFVAERLLIGHWPILVGYAVLPWVFQLAGRWRRGEPFPLVLLVLVPIGSLSAGAGLATAIVLLVAGSAVPGRGARGATRAWSPRRRLSATVALLVAGNAPWLVSGALHAATATSDPNGGEVFGLGGEGRLPAPLTALSLGGIWNNEVVPASRDGALAWVFLSFLVVLAALGLRRWWSLRDVDPPRLLICWAIGMALALVTWAAPGAVGTLVSVVPGSGLLRDGSRFLALAAPLVAAIAGVGAARLGELLPGPSPRIVTTLACAVLPVTVMPDAALGLGGRLGAVDYPSAYAEVRESIEESASPGDVLVLPLSSYRQPSWNDGRKVLDPTARYVSTGGTQTISSDVLVVSGDVLGGEDPRAAAAVEALSATTPRERGHRLAELGVGLVVVDRFAPGGVPEIDASVVSVTPELVLLQLDDPAEVSPPGWWAVAMSAAWAAFLGCFVLWLVMLARPLGRAGLVRRGARAARPTGE